MISENYPTNPALIPEDWKKDNGGSAYRASPEFPTEMSSLTKKGSVIELNNQQGHVIVVSARDAIKALVAISLRAFSHRDGSPIVSHEMIDRLQAGKPTSDDIAVLRSLLPPRELEPVT